MMESISFCVCGDVPTMEINRQPGHMHDRYRVVCACEQALPQNWSESGYAAIQMWNDAAGGRE